MGLDEVGGAHCERPEACPHGAHGRTPGDGRQEPEPQLAQPASIPSAAKEVPCADCHGRGVCPLCEGSAYSGGSGGYGRCLCVANNAGPGKCIECGGSGLQTVESAS